MSKPKQSPDVARFSIRNIGGIDETEVEIPPGITILTGENATNRTSCLYAIMAAMGSNEATLKADADQGRIELSFDNETHERTLERSGDSVRFSGNGYLEDPTVAELFAFLHEMNEARQAVAGSDDLREVIMRPVDVEAIKREIENLENRKETIKEELATIESRKQELPELEQRRNRLRNRIEDKRNELAEKEKEIDKSSRDIEESRKFQEKLETKFDDLRSVRSELDSVRRNIESQQESISSLKQERANLESELEQLPEAPMVNHQQYEQKISRLRNQRQMLNTEVSNLQSIIQYNKDRLDEEDYEFLEHIDSNSTSDGSLTNQLVNESESIVCWTCGSTVDREQIEATIDRLQSLREDKVTQLNDVKSDIEGLKAQKEKAEEKQSRRQKIERKLTETEDEIERREERVESFKQNREELTDEVEVYKDEIDDLESTNFEDVLELHKEANQLEFEIDDLESELDGVTGEIEEIETLVDESDDLGEKREKLVAKLEDKRTKIDQIEQTAVEEFNEHMDAILEILEYENLDRIWIERVRRDVREGRKKVEQTVFEMHVVRTTENGTAYEDTIDHLSESEREVTALIFALAGYLVHDLYETVPFMLLDSLEAIDANRIARLVEYFAEYAEYLVVALLPGDARALDKDITRITSI